MENNRPCEICGKSDIPCTVHSSGIGACSFNYCRVCSAMGAEIKIDDFPHYATWYNQLDDKYYDSSNKSVQIILNNGTKFDTRSEYVKYSKEK